MRRFANTSFVLLTMTLGLIGYQNCGTDQVQFNSAQEGLNAALPENPGEQVDNAKEIEESDISPPIIIIPPEVTTTTGVPSTPQVQDICASSQLEQISQNVEFDLRGSSTCEWGRNGNLDKRNGYTQARRESLRQLDLPDGAVVCGLALDFPTQKFKADDHFALTMNDIVLASDADYWFNKQNSNVVAFKYNWNNIKGIKHPVDTNQVSTYNYCFNQSSPDTYCSWPISEQEGKIELNFSQNSVFELSEELRKTSSAVYFRFVVSGDNDDSDCQQYLDNLHFRVDVQYAVPQ